MRGRYILIGVALVAYAVIVHAFLLGGYEPWFRRLALLVEALLVTGFLGLAGLVVLVSTLWKRTGTDHEALPPA